MNNEPQFSDLKLFCTVVRLASFQAAATELGGSAAWVSKRIAVLEAQLGVTLFHRTTRRMRISAEGEVVYARALRLLEDMGALADAVSQGAREPRGLLRISSSFRLGTGHVGPLLSALRHQHPGLEVWLELMDRRVDLIGEGFDLDIRAGEVQEPHLIAHHIMPSHRMLCAAPQYLQRRGEPRTLAELVQHDCLLFRDRAQTLGTWRLQGPNGPESVTVKGPMAANHSTLVRHWALDGHGIIMLSVWDAARELAQGLLVPVLPAYQQQADIWAVSSTRSAHSGKVQVCVDFLREQLQHGPYALQTQLQTALAAQPAPALLKGPMRA